MLNPWIFFPLMMVVGGIVISAIIFTIYFLIEKYGRYGASDFWGFVGGAFLVCGVGAGIFTLIFTAFPYNPHYWFMEEHSGTIVNISNQFDAGSGEKSDKEYVVELEGSNIPFITGDARILSFQKGDSIKLNCTNNWVYGGTDTTSCNIKF